MRKRLICVLLCVLVLVPGLAVTAYADCGPKPSTAVTVHGGGERMIMTLLGEKRGSGPYAEVQNEEEPSDDLTEVQKEAWRAFQNYVDADGYCFWGVMESNGMNWTYYPPEKFKVAVYYPDYDVLLVSGEVFERYAFHSDFRVYLPAVNENTRSGVIDMELSGGFDWMEELFGFLWRSPGGDAAAGCCGGRGAGCGADRVPQAAAGGAERPAGNGLYHLRESGVCNGRICAFGIKSSENP